MIHCIFEILKVLVVSNDQIIGVILALTAAFSWGLSAVLYKIGIKSESAFISLFVRSLSGVAFISIIVLFVNQFGKIADLFSEEIFWLMTISVVFLLIAEFLFFGALQRGDVSKIMPIASIYPLFSAIFLLVTGTEAFSAVVVIGTLVLVVGIYFVSQQPQKKSPNVSESEQLKIAIIMAITAAMFWGLAVLTIQLLLDHPIDVYSLAMVRFAIFAFFVAGLWTLTSGYNNRHSETFWRFSIHKMPRRTYFMLGSSGILGYGIGALCFFVSIDYIGALRATPISSVNPLIAAVFGVILLKEKISQTQALGILLVVFGSILVSIS